MIGNKIRKTLFTPLTDENSEFFFPGYPRVYSATKLLQMKRDPLFKRAKCVYVHKFAESKNEYRLCGMNRRLRRYGIAVLTDDNRFYMNEYRSKHTVLSYDTSRDMSKIFLDSYLFTSTTKIMFSDNIDYNREPVSIFLGIVAKAFNINILRRNRNEILNAVNYRLGNFMDRRANNRTGRLAKDSECRLGNRHISKFRRKLLEDGRLDFLPEKLMDEMLDTENASRSRRETIFWCAAGILHLYLLRLENENKRKKLETGESQVVNYMPA